MILTTIAFYLFSAVLLASALMVIAANDHLAVADEAFAAYNRALEPKRILVLDGGHFDAYIKDFERASGSARDWLTEHLLR